MPAQEGKAAPKAGDARRGADIAPRRTPKVYAGGEIRVRVDQDPMRIAPGETGTLLLVVALPRGRALADPNGRVVMASQPAFTYGAAQWDPPSKGKQYDDRFLVRMPVSVTGGTKHGRKLVKGTLHLTGAFWSELPDHPAGKDPGAAASRAAAPKRAEVPFQGTIRVGPPMPRPKLRRRSSSEPQTPPDTAKPTEPAGAEPRQSPTRLDGDRRQPAAAKGVSGEPEPAASVESEPGGSGAGDETDTGWLMLIAAVAGGLVLLLLARRRPG